MTRGTEISSETVQQFRCFQDLRDWEASVVAGLLEEIRLPAGEVLFRQGDPGDSVYLLTSGTVKIRMKASGAAEREVARLEAGAILGEIGLLLGEPRTATAVGEEPALLWRISQAAFRNGLQRGDTWAHQFVLTTAQVLARRLEMAGRELTALASEETEANPGAPRPVSRAADLEDLRRRLFTEWSF